MNNFSRLVGSTVALAGVASAFVNPLFPSQPLGTPLKKVGILFRLGFFLYVSPFLSLI